MKLLDCPLIGRRPISEFDYVGEVRKPPVDCDTETWAGFVFNRQGAPSVLRERWYHRPTGYWFCSAFNDFIGFMSGAGG